MQLPKVQFGHGDGRRKKSNTGEDGSYATTTERNIDQELLFASHIPNNLYLIILIVS